MARYSVGLAESLVTEIDRVAGLGKEMEMNKTYPAIIERGERCFGVIFPDFTGCVSVGDTIEDAIEMAHEALALCLSGMIEDGNPLPNPTPLEMVSHEMADLDGTVELINVACIVPITVVMPD